MGVGLLLALLCLFTGPLVLPHTSSDSLARQRKAVVEAAALEGLAQSSLELAIESNQRYGGAAQDVSLARDTLEQRRARKEKLLAAMPLQIELNKQKARVREALLCGVLVLIGLLQLVVALSSERLTVAKPLHSRESAAPTGILSGIPLGVYEVQVVDRESGAERWVQCQATSRNDAIDKVIALGEVVGEARLRRVVEPAPRASDIDREATVELPAEEQQHKRLRTNATMATTLAWIGLIVCGPLGLVAMFWGIAIRRESRGEFGTDAYVVGLIATAFWAFIFVLVWLMLPG